MQAFQFSAVFPSKQRAAIVRMRNVQRMRTARAVERRQVAMLATLRDDDSDSAPTLERFLLSDRERNGQRW